MAGLLSLEGFLCQLLSLCSFFMLVCSQTLSSVSIFEIWSTTENASNLTDDSTKSSSDHGGISLFHWNYDYVAEPLHITLFILLAGIVKIVFHHIPHLSSFVPESCVLIIIGTIMGAILKYGVKVTDEFRLETRTFMLFLLPPIVLEASYSLNDRMFSDNFGTILIYAIVGTVINFIIIGFSMYGLESVAMDAEEFQLTLLHFLIFASFIVAVDPVAVLAIFQDVRVNKRLYFLVFGESLLNDAVTIVLNNMMKAFNDIGASNITPEEVVLGIISFFTTTLGSLGIGILMGIISAFATRLTTHVRVMEPLAILMLAYLSYLCAEMCHWSGIISMIGCGLVQAQYALHNISRKSNITIHYLIKMLSSVADSIIFMFLGLELVRTNYVWNTGFILWALCLCLVARLVSVFGLTFFVNLASKSHPIKREEQFIMWYGGLRGAICFALCSTVEVEENLKNLFLTTTFIIIMFTVFGQGITIKPLVKVCKIIKDTDEEKELLIELHNLFTGNLMSGLDAILGDTGSSSIMNKIYDFNEKYLRRYLQKNPLNDVDQFLDVYREISMKYYMASLNKPTAMNEKEPAKANFVSVDMGERSNIEQALNREIKTNLHDGRLSTLSDFEFPLSEGELRQKLSNATLSSFPYSDPDYQLDRGKVSVWSEDSAANAAVPAGRRRLGVATPRNMLYTKHSLGEPAQMTKKDVTKLHKILSKASLASCAAFPHDRDLSYHDLEEFPAFDRQIKQDLAKSMLNLNVGSRHISFDTTGHPIVFKASSRRTSPFYSAQGMDNWLARRRSSTEVCNDYIDLENPTALSQKQESVEASSAAPLPNQARTVSPPGQPLPINVTTLTGQALPVVTITSPGQELPDNAATPTGQVSPVITIMSPGLPADATAAPKLKAENPDFFPELASSSFSWPGLSRQTTMASLSTLAEEQPEDGDLESSKNSQTSLVIERSLKVETSSPEAHTNVAMYLEMAESEVTPNTLKNGLGETYF